MIPQTAEFWIDKLKLEAHPEGGYYREIFRSKVEIPDNSLNGYDGKRNMFTSIYYLLKGGQYSAFHRIKSEEMWHFYNGSPITIYILNKEGDLEKIHLGTDPDNMESFQVCIPANCWFAAKVNNPVLYSLVGCTVSPGFDFNDFELATQSQLIRDYPQHESIIKSLTKV